MYQNPHQGLPQFQTPQQQQLMQQQQQQLMQQQLLQQQMQQMTPQQQQMLLMQQQQRQFQGQFPQQQQMMTPQQQQFMQQQMLQQQMLQQQQRGFQQPQMDQSTNARFGTPNSEFQSTNTPQGGDNRFGTGGTQMQPTQQQVIPPQFQPPTQEPVVVEQPTSFIVTPVKHTRTVRSVQSFNTNVNAITIKDVNLEGSDKGIHVEQSLDSIHSYLSEVIYSKDYKRRIVNVFNVIHANHFCNSDLDVKLTEMMKKPVKDFFKTFRKTFNEVENRYDYVVLQYLDDVLTKHTNEYLTTRTECGAQIDSFACDFNDLLKLIADPDNTDEEDYVDSISDLLTLMVEANSKVGLTSEALETGSKLMCVSEPLLVAMLDRHLLETGLETLGTELVSVEKHPNNLFIISVIEQVMGDEPIDFVLMTVDGSMFRVVPGLNKGMWISRI